MARVKTRLITLRRVKPARKKRKQRKDQGEAFALRRSLKLIKQRMVQMGSWGALAFWLSCQKLLKIVITRRKSDECVVGSRA